MNRTRVLMAMSGGVDSSVAASVLVEQGYEVIGATMQVWDYSQCEVTEGHGTCCSSTDVDDARAVADLLKIPFYVINCESRFKEKVIDPFIENYLQGLTPSPCVDCNSFLKFDHLFQKMKELDCQFLATGHYAQIAQGSKGDYQIFTSTDDWKDQTYFLFTLKKEILKHIMFPIGHMKKPDLRKYAEARGLINSQKRDSTGICFVGRQGYGDFVSQYADPQKIKPGKIKVYPTGEILGSHEGIHHFTYGQRKGLGLTYHEPLFVIKIDPKENTVWVGDEGHLFLSKLLVKNLNLLDAIQENELLKVKIRFHHQGALARVHWQGEQLAIEFETPQRAITPGQAAVFYRESQLVGGGWIV